MRKETKQSMTFNVLAVWGILSSFVLLGEPSEDMTAEYFWAAKGAALLSLILCLIAGRILARNGCLPEDLLKEDDEREDRP